MTQHRPHRVLVYALAVGGMAFAPAAFAYVDLGTGSMLIQALLGAIAVAGTLVRVYWSKLVGLLRRGTKEGASEHDR